MGPEGRAATVRTASPVTARPAGRASVAASVPVPAAAGARVRDRLAGPLREAEVVHRGRDAVYLDESGWALGVLAGRATRVPCALALATSGRGPELDLADVQRAEVGGGQVRLHLPDRVLVVRVGRLVDTTVPRLRSLPDSGMLALLGAHARPALDELGADLVRDVAERPERLLGLGSGLTPLGDDVVAGWAAASYALGVPVQGVDPRGATTLLSATLVDCARRGEVLPEFRELVRALAAPTREHVVERAAIDLAAVGHTSGAGLLLGACLRLEGR
jgi:hypothetical protein